MMAPRFCWFLLVIAGCGIVSVACDKVDSCFMRCHAILSIILSHEDDPSHSSQSAETTTSKETAATRVTWDSLSDLDIHRFCGIYCLSMGHEQKAPLTQTQQQQLSGPTLSQSSQARVAKKPTINAVKNASYSSKKSKAHQHHIH
ncbi:uncharacterized protein LOC126267361 [Schistocerca gregaria]|uniref:uncharacterized protein LOC126267361 n=1 Tax=Schistocerca gregaria TaxID=7010 RepID=UPI00211E2BA4|nr:uncharacterized protein LOC126267361 [Schistocerca gregaria]